MLAQMVHDEVKFCSTLAAVGDGDEAIRYLRAEGKHSDRKKPDIIFLDLTLPGKSGLEVLEEMKKVPGCELIPIVVLSASDNPVDIRKAYSLGANCVVRKPSQLAEFFRLIGCSYEFWCTVAKLPD